MYLTGEILVGKILDIAAANIIINTNLNMDPKDMFEMFWTEEETVEHSQLQTLNQPSLTVHWWLVVHRLRLRRKSVQCRVWTRLGSLEEDDLRERVG